MNNLFARRHRICDLLLALIMVCIPVEAFAEDALDLLSGFDQQRIAACFPVDDQTAAGEMSRLLFRLRRLQGEALASRVDLTDQGDAVGEVIRVSGTIAAIRQYKVPQDLVEFLDLEVFQELVLEQTPDKRSISLFAPPLAGAVSKGDRIRADAVLVAQDESSIRCASGKAAWMPVSTPSVGWSLLASQDVDMSLIADIATRSRTTLQPADSDAFFAILAAAKALSSGGVEAAAAKRVNPTDLLREDPRLHGEWIRLDVSTVRVTRVEVTNADRQHQLGQDHYFQIDASGDLGKTIVQLKRPDGDLGEPIKIGGRYPVSLVAAKLPEFLQNRTKGDRSVVTMVDHPVAIDGFFYRLWSYENEFMAREGGDKQIGPLIIVSRWQSRLPANKHSQGFAMLGYVMAAAIATAIIAIFLWTRRNEAEDARLRRKRQDATIIEID